MNNSPNSRCPECGLKNQNCQCQAKQRNKICYISIAIVLLLIAGKLSYNKWRLADASQPFFAALNTLPDIKIKANYNQLISTDRLKIELNIGEKSPATQIDKVDKILKINVQQFKTLDVKKLWCILVHEHSHLYNDIKVTPAEEKSFSYLNWARVVFHDEDTANLAETTFASQNNFLDQTSPDVCQYMKNMRVDLKTATSLATLDYLIKTDFPPYQKLKPYFPKVFLESIDPKYRDKFKSDNNL